MTWAGIISFLSAIPTMARAFLALVSMAEEMREQMKNREAEKVREEIKNAETEDDFRNAADNLTKLHD